MNNSFEEQHHKYNVQFAFLVLMFIPILACQAHYPDQVRPEGVAATDLSGKNFFYKKLCDLDLSHKNLEGANFKQAILTGVDLSYSNLRNADFTYADLRGANLQGSDLTGATLDRAFLRWADITDAVFDEKWAKIIDMLVTGDGSDLDLSGYDLSYVYFFDIPQSGHVCGYEWQVRHDESPFDLTGTRLQNANLEGAQLSAMNLNGLDFRGANLSNVILGHSNLRGANFRNANLTNAVMYATDLQGADFTDAILEGAWLDVANLEGAVLTNEQLGSVETTRCATMPDGSRDPEC